MKVTEEQQLYDLNNLWANIECQMRNLPADKLTKAFETKSAVLGEILEAKGSNDSKLPRKK